MSLGNSWGLPSTHKVLWGTTRCRSSEGSIVFITAIQWSRETLWSGGGHVERSNASGNLLHCLIMAVCTAASLWAQEGTVALRGGAGPGRAQWQSSLFWCLQEDCRAEKRGSRPLLLAQDKELKTPVCKERYILHHRLASQSSELDSLTSFPSPQRRRRPWAHRHGPQIL